MNQVLFLTIPFLLAVTVCKGKDNRHRSVVFFQPDTASNYSEPKAIIRIDEEAMGGATEEDLYHKMKVLVSSGQGASVIRQVELLQNDRVLAVITR
jgi:hypothetical protein